MTIFSPDGRYAYICSSFTPETVVVDTATYKTVGRVKQASTFCPNIAATPDGSQVWFTLKDTGKVQVFNARPPFNHLAVLETGPVTNHINLARTPKGQFAYVTVGGSRQVKVYSTAPQPQLLATIDAKGDNPHGLWPSGDGSRMYVGLQLSNAVAVIDTASNKVLETVDVGGQAPMALMYVPQALSAGSLQDPTVNLLSAAEARDTAQALHIELVSADAAASGGSSSGRVSSPGKASPAVLSSVTVNNQGFTASLEAAFSGLQPGQQYVLALASNQAGSGDLEPIASFKGGKDGAAGAAVLGPFTRMLLGSDSGNQAGKRKQARYLVVATLTGSGRNAKVGNVVQVQQAPAV